MNILSLHHIQLAMPEGAEALARAFYSGILGIPEVEKPEHLKSRGGVWFERGELRVHLGVERPFVAAKKAHPAFLVGCLAELVAKLAGGGYQVERDQPLAGFDRVYCSDPFGNRIELLQVVSDDVAAK